MADELDDSIPHTVLTWSCVCFVCVLCLFFVCVFAGAVEGPGAVCELFADGACRAGRVARRPETAAEVPPFPPLLTRHDLR